MVEELRLAIFEFRVEILEPLLLINASCDVKVLFVDAVNKDKLVLVVVIKPNCDVKVELIFDTELFNDEILVVWVFSVASWAANVEFVALVNKDKFGALVFIIPNWDVKVELMLDTDVFKLLIFTVLLATSEFKPVLAVSLVDTRAVNAVNPVVFCIKQT